MHDQDKQLSQVNILCNNCLDPVQVVLSLYNFYPCKSMGNHTIIQTQLRFWSRLVQAMERYAHMYIYVRRFMIAFTAPGYDSLCFLSEFYIQETMCFVDEVLG